MTRRQQIIEILQQNRQTAQQLANYFQVDLSEILEDLQHIEKSIKPRKIRTNPAYCRKCNFMFRERSRASKPSKLRNSFYGILTVLKNQNNYIINIVGF